MKTPEQKAEMVRQQVISKIHWGARQEEVTDWLQEEHGIVGAEAEQLLAAAYRARRGAVRGRAIVRLVLSAIGIGLTVAFFWLRFFLGVILFGPRTILMVAFAVALGVSSVAIFFRSLARLITGETPGSVD